MRLNDLINHELGRYRIEALIGRGGMAAVYRAFDTRLHRHVALKVLYPQYLADDDIVERFRREAVTAAQLDHPHIAPIYDVGEADGLIYLAMKLLPGPSLAELLQREQRLAPDRVVTLAGEIASALDEAHARGIIHRDIKPGNVLFDGHGRAVLTDFGIAKSLDAPSLTESSVIVGTPDYIAPEQIDSRLAPEGKIDRRADLYSLGAMLYRALTGRRPFDGPPQSVLLAHLRDEPTPPSTIVPELSTAVDAVLAKAMSKQPLERYASATELAQALANSLGDRTEVGVVFPPAALRNEPHARPTTQIAPQPVEAMPDELIAPATRRRFWLAPLSALLALVVVGGIGASFWGFGTPPQDAATAEGATQALPIATATRLITTYTPTATATIRPSATTAPSATTTSTATPSVTATTHVVASPSINQPAATPKAVATSRPAPQPTQRPPAPQPTSAPTAQPTSQPTQLPAPQATATESAGPCSVSLVGGFGKLWRGNASVQQALGCPTEPERGGYSVEQIFQGGLMYYRQEGDQFWVFSDDTNTWRRYLDVSINDPEPAEEAPAGLITPVRGFGRLWQKYPAVRSALGWATTPEVGFNNGVIQRFERGTLLYAPAQNGHADRIYALYNTGLYAIFRDTYAGP